MKKARIITTISFKGGVGKTSSTVHIASALALKGLKVLLIDFDPTQANTTYQVLGPIWETNPEARGICSAFLNNTSLDEVIYDTQTPNLSIVPSEKRDPNGRDYSIETAIAQRNPVEGFRSIKELINKSSIREEFDFVFIDTSPTKSMMALAPLNASDYFMVPVLVQDFSLLSISESIEVGKSVFEINPNLQFLGFYVSLYDKRPAETEPKIREMEEWAAREGVHFFKSKIPIVQKLPFLPSANKTIFDVTTKSARGHKDYIQLANEVLKRIMEIETGKQKSKTSQTVREVSV